MILFKDENENENEEQCPPPLRFLGTGFPLPYSTLLGALSSLTRYIFQGVPS